ncbi:MAG: DUF2357 domain-containing protein [Gemmatimonadetes bacterium]|nr:DUF2357 domain-containing protein [Gemmatimonadota bacterium]
MLADIEAVLPRSTCTKTGHGALVLNLVNSVGVLDLPGVGQVELHTGKLDEAGFEALLADLTRLATSLPFSAGAPGSSPYASGPPLRDEVLYHAFVYLRHILSDGAPAEERLLPALELIQRAPHRRWRTEWRDVPVETLTRVDSRTLLDLVTRTGAPVHTASLSPAAATLTERLGGRLPEEISERRIRATVDTPENRFAKAFIGQAGGIIGRVRSKAASRRDVFGRSLLADCDRMEAALMPVARHSMWDEVGTMVRIPLSSTVLQRRRGYRHVLRHYARIRLAPRIPLDGRKMRDLLELKDIALLYELWTFFRLAEIICGLLGLPVRSARTDAGDDFQVVLGWNRTFEWPGGTRLAYNESFSRSERSPYHAYSVPLRPDITLHVPEGPNCGLHVLDAKFRVQTLGEAGLERDEDPPEKASERRGDFKRGDISKMHTYRDAIRNARSVWILYPGSEFRFFDALNSRRVIQPTDLPSLLEGVGAIPFAPKPDSGPGPSSHGEVTATLRKLLDPQSPGALHRERGPFDGCAPVAEG